GALVTRDAGVTIFAGSCLGGGSTINWTGSFRTPDYILDEWANDHGFLAAKGSAFRAGEGAVMSALGTNRDHSPHNPQNDALWRGSEVLGNPVEVIERNVVGCQVDGCKACGYCGLGCRRGTKQSTVRTWLPRATAAGARILVNTTVQCVSSHLGAATGVEGWTRSPEGRRIGIRIRAKRVVVAAGSVQTPALLLRSGLNHPKLGFNLFFHPTVAVAGFYKDRIAPWYGPMMSAVNKAGIRLDGNYGYWVETPPLHPGTAALALPWISGKQHKQDLLRVGNMASFIVLTRDKYGGRVQVDRQGNARVAYALHSYDRAHLLKGVQAAFQIHRAAGASDVIFPHNSRKQLLCNASQVDRDAFLHGMPGWGWGPNQFALFTAHQMGTCALGGDAALHPVAPDGSFRGLRGLFIADGSLMPTSAGINPMIPIMALAHWVGKGME
ncbi:MAG TPA: oxidoreductase, partial [Bacteroidetes bacterium]|nr:oxidoreductase [Bacteroidota bacterium]